MWILKKIIDLILYGNFWIALGALVLTLQTKYILGEEVAWDEFGGLVFFSTWLLYSLHRIVGILRMEGFLDLERYSVIAKFRSHIIIYAIIATIGTIWYFFHLSPPVQIAVVLPGLFSLAYVLPFFGKRKRLRDFNQIKIYLIAFVWAWVTVVLPAVASGSVWSWSLLLMFLERALFVFAITLPFDIRDLKVDGHTEVSTIPAVIGVDKTRSLALGLLGLGLVLIFINGYLGFYAFDVLVGLMISFISTGFLIRLSSVERHDYFYSGLMDGTMVFQGLWIWLYGVLLY
ncbi:MAG: 4-hydroxybenzoate polyprenyltransferase [Saprospiraceae bacterium]|jgi:4-hydroxybenzoate polyprenyltransferase